MSEELRPVLVEPLALSDGEIEGLTPTVAYVAGCSEGELRARLKLETAPFTMTVRRVHVEGLAKMAVRRHWAARITFLDDYWADLSMEPTTAIGLGLDS